VESQSNDNGNWVARAIDFRLAQRNLIEFSAKNEMGLPIQITGCLFMVRADVLRATGFRGDLCEDWELTLDLYSREQGSGGRPRIVFDPALVSYCEATTSLGSYFRQRQRVSEGHTRGFRKRAGAIIRSRTLSPADKLDLFMVGLQYAKYMPVFLLPIIDWAIAAVVVASTAAFDNAATVFKASLALQAACLVTAIATNAAAARLCGSVRNYTLKDVAGLLALNIATIPAFAAGSLRGFFRNKGTFHRTQRNGPRMAEVPAEASLAASRDSAAA
jgi:cellulose synthase/poly-beta-1,6-N-acetylglucosamine synthase-like glycosyltransferase